MKLYRLAVMFYFVAVAFAATPREVYSNSTVHLSWTLGPTTSTGSGFILARPVDPSKVNEPQVSAQAFLVTNKHVLPPEGHQCTIAMRATTISNGSLTTKTIAIPIVGADGK